jgi:nitrile hydratase subunit alpha
VSSLQEHHHDHGDGHGHGAPPSPIEARVRTIESLLVEKGLIDHAAVDAVVETFENDLGPMVGARIVAKAWVDADFKRRLIEDATSIVDSLGHAGLEATNVVAVENDDTTHNVIVCTLCSCYPWALLGIPPKWYKSPDYRARIVSEPRKVLEEFGVSLGEDVRVRVWDSSADVRYLVIPQRPAGTEGMSEEELAQLITRDSMIGVGMPKAPATT